MSDDESKRRLKKLTRNLLGTSDVYRELIPDPHAEHLYVPVDSEWADDRETRQSCTRFRYAEDESSLERRSRPVRDRLRNNRILGSSTTFSRMAVQDSAVASDRLPERARSVQTQRAGSNETCRAEDAHSAGMAKKGTTSSSQNIDSPQPSRPHDEGHDSRETDQVRTCLELARITLDRLEPTCTVVTTAVTSATSVTVNSSQCYRLTAHGETCVRLRKHTIPHKHSPQTALENPRNAVCSM